MDQDWGGPPEVAVPGGYVDRVPGLGPKHGFIMEPVRRRGFHGFKFTNPRSLAMIIRDFRRLPEVIEAQQSDLSPAKEICLCPRLLSRFPYCGLAL